jgi:hypothetical protein
LEFSRKLFLFTQVCYYVIAPATAAAAVCRHIAAGSIVYTRSSVETADWSKIWPQPNKEEKNLFFSFL